MVTTHTKLKLFEQHSIKLYKRKNNKHQLISFTLKDSIASFTDHHVIKCRFLAKENSGNPDRTHIVICY